MSLTLQELCAHFCAIAQVASPELREENDGTTAFNIFWRDVTIDLMAQPSADPAHALVLFHMGTPDPAHSEYPRILQALLQTNFVNLRANQPVLSCQPATGAAVLQWAIPLAGTSAEQLLQWIEHGVDLVLQWRESHFLAPAVLAAAPHDLATSFA